MTYMTVVETRQRLSITTAVKVRGNVGQCDKDFSRDAGR